MTEVENINAQLKLVGDRIKVKEAKLKHHQDRWEDFEAGQVRSDLGRDRQLWTALNGRKQQIQTVDETSTRSSAIFSGSNF
jgi:hypothetical protein